VLRRSLALLAVVLVAGSVLAACGGGGGGDGGGGGRADVSKLRGNEWVLDQEASNLGTIGPTGTVTARFGENVVSGSAGCNNYSAPYEVDGSSLTLSAQIATTQRLCAGLIGGVESAYLARLAKARSYGIAGDVLTIETSAKAGPLVYRAVNADDALAGKWEVLNSFRPGAVTSPVPGSTLTAEFADGTISGNSGCNQYTGPYEASGTSITIGPLASTLRACADPAVGQQETEYLAALELARTFSVAGGNLNLFREDGGIAVTFAKA
jgi:heat shock protein HslJ